MQLISVESSMIRAVGYDASSQELEILFNSGKTYRYTNVPEKIYQQLLASESKGQYMHSCIIGMYPEYKISRRR